MFEEFETHYPSDLIIAGGEQFAEWTSLNDTIMGGSSLASCRVTSNGLVLEGELVEEGGGFVSCRSPFLTPPLDLTSCLGLHVQVDGSIFMIPFYASIGLACFFQSVFGCVDAIIIFM